MAQIINLLDDTATFTSEKTALPSLNSLRTFEVADQIKSAINQACNGNACGVMRRNCSFRSSWLYEPCKQELMFKA